MTPPAMTPAGARTAERPRNRVGEDHPRPVRGRPAPKAPRRVSGPLRSGATTVRPRVAAPVRSDSRRKRGAPLQERAIRFVRALPDHRLLDRIVRGRTWIVILGVLLAGIVAMQVEMLKLNSSIGRSIALGTALQSRNELLRASVSSLSADQRIERLASRMGMVMPGPTSLDFLDANRIHVGAAAASIHAPDSQAFTAALEASAAAAASASGGTATATPTSATTATPGSAASSPSSAATASTATAPTSGTTAAATPIASAPTAAGPTAATPTVTAPATAAPATGGATPATGQQSPTGG